MQRSRLAIKSVDVPFWHTTSDDGIVLPAFLDQDRLAEIRQKHVNPSDIFIASFPKSGF